MWYQKNLVPVPDQYDTQSRSRRQLPAPKSGLRVISLSIHDAWAWAWAKPPIMD